MSKRNKKLIDKILLYLVVIAIPPIVMIAMQFFSLNLSESAERAQTDPAPEFAHLSGAFEQDRESLPRDLTNEARLIDIYFDDAEGAVYLTIDLPPGDFTTFVRDAQNGHIMDTKHPIIAPSCDAPEFGPPTILEFRATRDSPIYRSMTLRDILCNS